MSFWIFCFQHPKRNIRLPWAIHLLSSESFTVYHSIFIQHYIRKNIIGTRKKKCGRKEKEIRNNVERIMVAFEISHPLIRIRFVWTVRAVEALKWLFLFFLSCSLNEMLLIYKFGCLRFFFFIFFWLFPFQLHWLLFTIVTKG